jgi:hypothetical protein
MQTIIPTTTTISQLIREIQSLIELQKNLEGQRKNIHADEIALLFSTGAKIEQLKKACTKHGDYKPLLMAAGLNWTTADRQHKTFLLFGEYRNTPWILNFGKSALMELSYHNFKKDNNRAIGLVAEAIELAKSGTEIGVAWVNARIEGRRAAAGIRRTRMSARVRKAIHAAIDQHGEEKVLEAISALGGVES